MSRVLVFRIGSLGDTLVAVPALWALRSHFAGSPITLLCDHHPRSRYVLAADLLHGAGIVDDVLLYSVDPTPVGRALRPLRMAALMLALRRRRFDTLVYLAPSARTSAQVARDRAFFAAAGIRDFLGMEGFPLPDPVPPQPPLPHVPREGERLLERLARAGVAVPLPGAERIDVNLGPADEAGVERWCTPWRAAAGARRWISVGPGGKQPVNVWPEERYDAVVRELIGRHDVWPVVYGGPVERALGERLVQGWGRGANAAGVLGLRASMAAMRRCAVHLGNDTGTLHMAAAARLRCVALYSAHNWPGRWYPWGEGHTVFRTAVECEGCRLQVCSERGMACMLAIGPAEVVRACTAILAAESAPR